MTFLKIVLNIIVFLVCLSVVVCIHEAGHLMTAKLFNVYCFEYSIGFGPKLFTTKFLHRRKKGKPFKGTPVFDAAEEERREQEARAIQEAEATPTVMAEPVAGDGNHPLITAMAKLDAQEDAKTDTPARKPRKKKKYHLKHTDLYNYYEGETYFSIRALPLGGFVSMAGEDGEDNEQGIKVPPERTITGINHLKQCVIMLAGIVMNFLLAIILMLFDFGVCPQQQSLPESNRITVSETIDDKATPAYAAGLRSGDRILTLYQEYHVRDENGNDAVRIFPEGWESDPDSHPMTSYLTFEDKDSKDTSVDNYARTSIAYAVQDVIARNMSAIETQAISVIESFRNVHADETSYRLIHITYQRDEGEKQSTIVRVDSVLNKDGKGDYYTFGKLGISSWTTTFRYTFAEAFRMTFEEFGYIFVNLYKALGSVFTPSGWKNMGGIISVYRVSSQGMSSGSAAYFILLWAYISINLGCFNLLPFPGLDGWQTLLAIIEGVIRKKIPTKVKGVANLVGMLVLFALAVLLVIKDIVNPLI